MALLGLNPFAKGNNKKAKAADKKAVKQKLKAKKKAGGCEFC